MLNDLAVNGKDNAPRVAIAIRRLSSKGCRFLIPLNALTQDVIPDHHIGDQIQDEPDQAGDRQELKPISMAADRRIRISIFLLLSYSCLIPLFITV